MKLIVYTLIGSILFSPPPPPRAFVVCQTGAFKSSETLSTALQEFFEHLSFEVYGNTTTIEWYYTNDAEKCEHYIEKLKPPFIFPSLGLLFKWWNKYRLEPIAQVSTLGQWGDRFYLISSNRYPVGLREKEKFTIAGNHVSEECFVGGVVLGGRYSPEILGMKKCGPDAAFELSYIEERIAILLDGFQYARFRNSPLKKDFHLVYVSREMPNTSVAAIPRYSNPREIEKMKKALIDICGGELPNANKSLNYAAKPPANEVRDNEPQRICSTLGIGFRRIKPSAYKTMLKKYREFSVLKKLQQ